MELGEAPEPGRPDYFASAPTTPLSVLGRGIPHQLCAVSPMTQAGDDLEDEGVKLKGSSAISTESSDSDSSSRDKSDASSSDDGAPTPTATQTAARQLRAHMSGPGDEEIREARTRARLIRKRLQS